MKSRHLERIVWSPNPVGLPDLAGVARRWAPLSGP